MFKRKLHLLFISTIFIAVACSKQESSQSQVEPSIAANDSLVALEAPKPAIVLSPAPPNTTVPNSVTNADGLIDTFAWKTFIAMNWPAIVPSSANGFTRGIPDTSMSFGPSTLGVWETFKEKREVFNQGTNNNEVFTPVSPGPWYSDVNYGPLRKADGAVLKSPAPHPAGERVFHSGMKSPFNALDETIEVASEALEPTSPHLNSVVAPRVWRLDKKTGIKTPILYEVKVNYDFYHYLLQQNLWDDSTSQNKAQNNQIHLPWRTSTPKADATLNENQKNNSKAGYDANSVWNTYKTFSATSPNTQEPPRIGAVHIKAAWIALSDAEIKSKQFHTTQAYYYESNATGEPVAKLNTFGLIGLHIIQRIHFNQQNTFQSEGGTFVFATWEHSSIQETIDNSKSNYEYQYSNYFDPSKNGVSGPGSFGPIFPVERRPGAVLSQTQTVNASMHKQFPAGSVWKNYNLIGTQFKAVDTTGVAFKDAPSKAEKDLGQNSYLANLVLETNHGLQNFRGLPPLITSTQIVAPYNNASSISPPIAGNSHGGPVFDRDAKNTAAYGSGVTMGGCMGCHGVAQVQGFNFSFVLLGGNEGAKTDTQSHFDLPSGGPFTGGPVFLTTQGSDGVWTFNLSTQTSSPTQIATTAGLGFRGIAQYANSAYLTTQGSDGIWTFDLATQKKPTQIASTAGLGFRQIAQVGNTLYLTTQGGDGIWTFNLETQVTPTQIPSTAGLGFRDLLQIGNALYLTTQGGDGIWTFDLTEQTSAPVQIPSTAGLGFRSLVQNGKTLYLTTQGGDGIWTFELNKLTTAPKQIPSTAGLGFRDLIQAGTTLYLTTQGGDGIWQFDINKPTTAPAQIPSTANLGFRGLIESFAIQY